MCPKSYLSTSIKTWSQVKQISKYSKSRSYFSKTTRGSFILAKFWMEKSYSTLLQLRKSSERQLILAWVAWENSCYDSQGIMTPMMVNLKPRGTPSKLKCFWIRWAISKKTNTTITSISGILTHQCLLSRLSTGFLLTTRRRLGTICSSNKGCSWVEKMLSRWIWTRNPISLSRSMTTTTWLWTFTWASCSATTNSLKTSTRRSWESCTQHCRKTNSNPTSSFNFSSIISRTKLMKSW